MELGTTVYFKHSQALDFFVQAEKIVDIMAGFGYLPSYQEKSRPDNWGGCRFDGIPDAKPFSSLQELKEFKNEVKSAWFRFCDTNGNRKITFLYEKFHPRSHYLDQKAIWKMEAQEIDISLGFASNYTHENEVGKEYSYSIEEVLFIYNLIKKIYLEVGFDLAAGSSMEGYFGYGIEEGGGAGYDRLLRFDRHGINRLIIPYEEGRRICNDDWKLHPTNPNLPYRGIVEYNHPVPIIVREPPYTVQEPSNV